MKLLVYPIGDDGECLSLPTQIYVRLNEDVLEGGWTLAIANQIKVSISRNIKSASDPDYPSWVQALHSINAKRVLLVNANDQSQQWVFRDAPPTIKTFDLVESVQDDTVPGMINRRSQILQTLKDLDNVLLAKLPYGN